MKHNVIVAMLLLSVLSITAKAADTDSLHFHIIKNSPEGKLVSNIPKSGFTHNGKMKRRFNPNSIVYQQKQLLKRLQEEQAQLDFEVEMALQEELKQQKQKQKQQEEADSTILGQLFSKPEKNIIRKSSGRGVLQDLIDLEKRGGRAETR